MDQVWPWSGAKLSTLPRTTVIHNRTLIVEKSPCALAGGLEGTFSASSRVSQLPASAILGVQPPGRRDSSAARVGSESRNKETGGSAAADSGVAGAAATEAAEEEAEVADESQEAVAWGLFRPNARKTCT